MQLAIDQQQRVQECLETYREPLAGHLAAGDWTREREERSAWFQGALGPDEIDDLTEEEFGDIIKSLWASLIWGNKDYLVSKILSDNDFDRIKAHLKCLLHGDAPLAERFDQCDIKGLGPSSITEIMCFVAPDEYCIWNDKPKNVLPALRLNDLLPDRVFKYQISGGDYELCLEAMALILREMERAGFQGVDFLDVDILMWFLFNELPIDEILRTPEPEFEGVVEETEAGSIEVAQASSLTHWDAMALLLELGNCLGYDTYTADPSRISDLLGKPLSDLAMLTEIPPFTYARHLDTVRYVDVIWFRDEFPTHCFEVEHTTDVTRGLLRLYQVRKFTDARLFIVAPTESFAKFKTEIIKDPFYEIRERYQFRSYEELLEFWREAIQYSRLRENFLGDAS